MSVRAPGFSADLSNVEALVVVGVLGILAYVVYEVVQGAKQLPNAVGAGVSAVGGALTGNNPLTQGTDYAGTGILGTLGAAANDVTNVTGSSTGTLDDIGNWLGGKVYDLTHPTQP